jgi:hypothetical protein
MNEVHVCAPCAYGGDVRAAELLQKSCDKAGVPLHLVGTDTSWTSHFSVKVPTMIKHLRRLHPYDIVMTIDCTDTLLLAGKKELFSTLKGLDNTILMSAERSCESDRSLAPQLNNIAHFRGMYPNSGGIVGRAGALLNAYLDLMTYYAREQDQESWHLYCIAHPDRVVLDCVGDVFLSMHDAQEYEVKAGRVWTDLWSCPAVLHYAGRVSGREEMWEKLNLT